MAENKNSIDRKTVFLVAILMIAIASIMFYNYAKAPKITDVGLTGYSIKQIFKGDYQTTTLKLPAVNTNNTGVSAYLIVDARKGTGNIFLDVNSVLSKEDTQHSVRLARNLQKSTKT